MGPDVTKTPCVDLTDVTLADDLGVRSPNPLPKASGLGNLTREAALGPVEETPPPALPEAGGSQRFHSSSSLPSSKTGWCSPVYGCKARHLYSI